MIYVDAVNGDDANDGRTWSTAVKTTVRARGLSDAEQPAHYESHGVGTIAVSPCRTGGVRISFKDEFSAPVAMFRLDRVRRHRARFVKGFVAAFAAAFVVSYTLTIAWRH